MTPAQSFRMALWHWLIVISIAVVLSAAGGCAVDVTHDAGGGWHVSAGPFVFLLTLAALIYSWGRRP